MATYDFCKEMMYARVASKTFVRDDTFRVKQMRFKNCHENCPWKREGDWNDPTRNMCGDHFMDYLYDYLEDEDVSWVSNDDKELDSVSLD